MLVYFACRVTGRVGDHNYTAGYLGEEVIARS